MTCTFCTGRSNSSYVFHAHGHYLYQIAASTRGMILYGDRWPKKGHLRMASEAPCLYRALPALFITHTMKQTTAIFPTRKEINAGPTCFLFCWSILNNVVPTFFQIFAVCSIQSCSNNVFISDWFQRPSNQHWPKNECYSNVILML